MGSVALVTPLRGLALSRSAVDRRAERRAEPGLLEGLLADDATAVLVLAGDRVLIEADAQGSPAVALLSPASPPPGLARLGVSFYLGEDASGRSYVALCVPAAEPVLADLAPLERGGGQARVDGRVRWAGLREVGSLLDDAGAGLATAALALGNWHTAHTHCARCGTPTTVVQAGWARGCPHCGAEHYPRTDPAVIMAVVDDEDRILLGRQASWPAKRYSTLAGFVEPGESLEAAVRREVAEESQVEIGDVEYRGSQPWPFPSSLMLGFRARALTTAAQADGVELAHARWWTREQFAADIASRELLLPPRVSIARRLIEDWFGRPVDAADWAR
ncbi:MAG: NAD(+) diphosphatase [Kineosporiaceae bacterium]